MLKSCEILWNPVESVRAGSEGSLGSLQVNNVLVQRKALAEFLTVYQAASVIAQCGHAHSG